MHARVYGEKRVLQFLGYPMITNGTAARQVSDLMIELKDQMMDSLTKVKETCSPEEYRAYHEAVGRIVHSILVNVLEPLYNANPELKPGGWDE